MKKRVCYVLTISKYFPSTHPRAGEETHFEEKILALRKLHTIRANYKLWQKRFKKIDKGEAYISVRQWTGKPYRSKQVELFQYDKSDGIGIQKINIAESIKLYHYNRYMAQIAYNDGLGIKDFINWFKSYKSSNLVIIHFTEFRY
jgi:hypothetical protein